jgi:SAM-dependent methyltransferase
VTTSANFRKLTTPEEIENCKIYKEAWKHPDLPMKQWEAFANERKAVAEGRYNEIAPFRAFLSCADYIDKRELGERKDILDVGASSGYYNDLLVAGGFSNWHYTACDYSPAFKAHAAKVLPHVRFDIADICDLPYADKTFNIVSADLTTLHLDDWRKAISEIGRVASEYLILHRVFTIKTPTELYTKTAYGIPVNEIWINEQELFSEVRQQGWNILYGDAVFTTNEINGYSQWDYVCGKY